MKFLFKLLAKVNKVIMPSYKNKDLMKLSNFDKLMVGYRYYVTKKSLE